MRYSTLHLICACLDRVINNRRSSSKLKKIEHEELRKILTPHKTALKRLLNKSTSDKSRRRVLMQRGGAIGSIIATLLPLLISSFTNLFKK